jgi:hypothetical protein
MMAQVPCRHGREAVWLLPLLGVVLAFPASAPASILVSADDGKLVVRAEGTELNVVDVRRDGPSYRIYSPASPLTTGPGCLPTDLGEALCFAEVGAAIARGGDGSDVMDFFRVPLPVDAEGGDGDDALRAGAAGGVLRGGSGVDELLGGKGEDVLYGENDDDLLEGRAGADTVFGGDDADVISGGSGSVDVLAGGSGPDLLKGGDGRDLVNGGPGPDALAGGPGNDVLSPGAGDDRVFGPNDADVLQCPTPIETVSGPTQPCADVVSRHPPDTWPPPSGGSTSTARSSDIAHADAWPVVPRNATLVRVRVPASSYHPIGVCIETRLEHGGFGNGYGVQVYTKYWQYVRIPKPRLKSFRARVLGPSRC